jgi:hypothetical protein
MRALILLLLPAALILSACASFRTSSRANVPPLDSAIAAPCTAPEVALTAGDWKIIAARLGTALIDCGARHAAAVAAYNDVASTIAGDAE